MGRTRLVAANWKMYKTVAEAAEFGARLRNELADPAPVEGVVCAPFTTLAAVGPALAGSPYLLGAQNLHWEAQGAFTGEISGPQLADLGCRFVIVGHSERRQYFHETDAGVRLKLQAAYRHGLRPILCIGETGPEREAGRTEAVLLGQLRGALDGLEPGQAALLTVAYEPVWAIGSGVPATAPDAQAAAALIRGHLSASFGREAAGEARIQYGGSVKPDNLAEFVAQPDIDGALVGGASLRADSFAALLRAAAAGS